MTPKLIASTILALVLGAPPSWKVPGAYDRDAAPYWGHKFAVSDSTTTFVSVSGAAWTSGNESTIKLHTWGTRIKVSCNLGVWVCVVMDDDVTLNDDTDGGQVADAGVPDDGIGKCIYVSGEAGGRGSETIVIDRDLFETGAVAATSSPGYRALSCSAPAAMVGRPCDNADDCPTGGTCDGTAILGAYAAFIADTTGTECAVTELL